MGAQVAPIGVALIAKDAAETLPACLKSIRPYVQQIVVGVDERTTDATAKVARKYGADVVKPIKVSDWHECPQHGRVLAQHFAQAREQSFALLDPSLPWRMWVDADDIVKDANLLKAVVEQADERVMGVWLPYHYGTIGNGAATTTRFHRERLLRWNTDVQWAWEGRVHEVINPSRQGVWLKLDSPAIYHQEGVHKTDSSVDRNQLLLEIDLEQEPNNPRTLWYLGNGRFAAGDWQGALHWYQEMLAAGGGPNERWSSCIYASHACQNMGDLEAGYYFATLAMREIPNWPESYYRLAALSLAEGKNDRVEFWTDLARTKTEEPPFMVFVNPLDAAFNSRLCLANALAAEGRMDEAGAEFQAAYDHYQDPRVGEQLQQIERLKGLRDQAQAFVTTVEYLKDDEATKRLYEGLPRDAKGFGRVRDVAVPALLRGRRGTQPRIVFWCGQSFEEWAADTPGTTGIGGSETAVVEVAKRFQQAGWMVDVYNNCGSLEGEYDGVGYWDCSRFVEADPIDIFVKWRSPNLGGSIRARAGILWCHDLNYGPEGGDGMRAFSAVVGVSQWHADYLARLYGLDNVGYVPNGIDLSRFPALDLTQKKPMQCVYASSADRGLARLLTLWPQLIEGEPGASLHIAYGWDTIDRMIAAGRSDLAAFKADMQALIERTPQVVYRGRLNQQDLATLYAESVAWLYPTSFLEVSCISAMEAMAGGAVPITSRAGALPETIGGAGLIVDGLPESRPWPSFYTHVARGVLTDPNLRNPFAYRARKRAEALTWDASFSQHWLPLVEGLLSGKKELVAA